MRITPVAVLTPVLRQPNLHPYLWNAMPVSVKRFARRRELVRLYPYSYYTRRTFTFLSDILYIVQGKKYEDIRQCAQSLHVRVQEFVIYLVT